MQVEGFADDATIGTGFGDQVAGAVVVEDDLVGRANLKRMRCALMQDLTLSVCCLRVGKPAYSGFGTAGARQGA